MIIGVKSKKEVLDILGLTIVFIVGLWYYHKQNTIFEEILKHGIYIKALVKESYYMKSTYTTKVSFRYEGIEYESKGYSPKEYLVGDSILIKFDHADPTNLIIIEKDTMSVQR